MNWSPLVIFGCGFAFGLLLGLSIKWLAWEDEKKEHEETVMTQGEEIARLRAQVADIIGRGP